MAYDPQKAQAFAQRALQEWMSANGMQAPDLSYEPARKAYEEALFNLTPQPGEDMQAYLNRVATARNPYMTGGSGKGYVGLWKLMPTTEGSAMSKDFDSLMGAFGSDSQSDVRGGLSGSDSGGMDAQIKRFITAMNRPLDMNDPEVQRISKLVGGMASSRAQDQARLQGVEGGLAVANSEQAVANAVTPALNDLQNQRRQLGLQAMSLQNNRELGLGQLAQNQYQFDARLAQDRLDREYAYKQAQGQMVGSLLGGLAGGIGGYMMAPQGQGLQGAQWGMNAGSQFGAGLGGMYGGGAPQSAYGGSSGYSTSGGRRYRGY